MKSPFFYGWFVILLVVIFQGASLGFMGATFTFWVQPWMEEFNVTRTEVMGISTAMMLVMGVFTAALGRVFDRFNANIVVPLGLLIFAVSLWFGSMAQSFWQVSLVYAFMLPAAVSLSGTMASQALAVKWFTGHAQMGLAIGIAAMGVSVGGMILPQLVAKGLEINDWRWVFEMAALAIGLVLAPLMFVCLLPKPPSAQPAEDSTASQTAEAEPAIPVLELFTNKYFIIPAVAFFLDSVAYIGFQFNTAPYMSEVGLDKAATAAIVSTQFFVMLLAKLLIGKLTDFFHYRTVFILAALCNVVGLTIFSLAIEPLLIVAIVFIGLGAGGLIPLQAKIISTHFGASQFAHVFGFFVFFPMAAIFGAPILSYLAEIFGSYQTPLLIMVGFVVAAIVLMLSLGKEQAQGAEA